MERLTIIDGIGQNEVARCMGCGLEKAGEELENCGYCEEGWQKALKKLAAYEDTGLEPEEICENIGLLSPICIGCSGKTADGMRTDLCGYPNDLRRCLERSKRLERAGTGGPRGAVRGA